MISFAHDGTFASVPIAIAGHFSKTANGGALTAFNDITIMRTKQTTSATYEDYMRLREGAPYQLIAGQLVHEPAPTWQHQSIVNTIGTRLTNHIWAHNLGHVVQAPIDVKLSDADVFQRDIVFISHERASIIRGHVDGAPDLVVEVLSPSTARNDLNPKRRMYESSGVLEYWIVDPATASIEILTNDAGQFATHDRAATSGLVHSKVLRGFTIDVADVFR